MLQSNATYNAKDKEETRNWLWGGITGAYLYQWRIIYGGSYTFSIQWILVWNFDAFNSKYLQGIKIFLVVNIFLNLRNNSLIY